MKRATAIVLTALSILLAVLATVIGVFIGLVRRRDERFVRAFTRLQRDVLNPNVLKNAGTAGERTAVIETVGRRSGTRYETPITPLRDGDGWCAALVYGPTTSWARNAVAAGEAVLRIDGTRHRVDQIEIVPLRTTEIGRTQSGLMTLLRIEEAVRMRDAGILEPAPAPATEPES